MKKIALTAIGLLVAGSASAADLRQPLPVKAAPAPVAVAYNWTGCYIGAGGGYGMFDQETQYNVTGIGPVGAQVDNGGRGWFGTVQVGCDYQVGSNIVIGAFADYDFSDISGTMSSAAVAASVGNEKLKSSWAAGGRIGWFPFAAQNLLVYVSGGYTQARFDAVAFSPVGGGPLNGLGLAKHTYDGWFLGSGYEYQLGWFPGLTWKTEYRFADYSADNVQLTQAGLPLPNNYLNNHKFVQTVRSDLVWRFNFGGPVVARY